MFIKGYKYMDESMKNMKMDTISKYISLILVRFDFNFILLIENKSNTKQQNAHQKMTIRN